MTDLARRAANRMRRYYSRKESGRCVTCGDPYPGTGASCPECREVRRMKWEAKADEQVQEESTSFGDHYCPI